MSSRIGRKLARSKRRIQSRLGRKIKAESRTPVIAGSNIHYEIAERARGIGYGGIGAIHLMAKKIGLVDAIDRQLELLKIHLPYHESDHVLNIAYNALCGGRCLENIEWRRNDEVFLDALGADRIPDPSTAGDFCRRFGLEDIYALENAINKARLRVWAQQPAAFFAEAILDMDGSLVVTTGECKQGMDISYKGTWGYHPLILSLANTGEVLALVNRSGNRPSHEGAFASADDAMSLCRQAGFRRILMRGDTDFTQSEHLDRWSDAPDVRFVFGVDQMENLVEIADDLTETRWRRLRRRNKRPRQGEPRQRPDNVKEQIVIKRGFKNLRLESEDIAEFRYSPVACQKTYRMVVVRKNICEEQGGVPLFPDLHRRYLFYITNEMKLSAEEIVFLANDRCNQENLIEQLKHGVPALTAPVDNLESNWAFMVMTALAWNLKAWFALQLPAKPGRWQEKHRREKERVLRMEFKTFLNYFVLQPSQIIKAGRRILYRLLSWNPWQEVFFRFLAAMRC